MVNAAAGRLQSLSLKAVNKLESIITLPVGNETRTGRRRADPALIREQRIAGAAIINLALKTKQQADEARREAELDALLADDTESDEDSTEILDENDDTDAA